MTARPVETGAELRPYPIDQEWRRGGFYVAKLTGEDPRYGVGRDFLDGKPVKSRKTIEYSVDAVGELPAWILRRPVDPCPTCSQTRKVRDTGEEVIAAFASGWVNYGRVFGVEDLLAIHASGRPGDPGAWNGERCAECSVTPIFGDPGGVCEACQEAIANRDHLEALPSAEVF